VIGCCRLLRWVPRQQRGTYSLPCPPHTPHSHTATHNYYHRCPTPACLQLKGEQAKYQKLLAKHNRLINKCVEAKVDWHRTLDPRAAKKTREAPGGAAVAAAAAAATPAPAAGAAV
jgi:uncharacterized protein YdcH (DUF465 family)